MWIDDTQFALRRYIRAEDSQFNVYDGLDVEVYASFMDCILSMNIERYRRDRLVVECSIRDATDGSELV